MTTVQVFSLWLQPTGQAFDQLAFFIKQLSEECRTPVFEPHVTLLGELAGEQDAIVARATPLAKLIHPGIIKLTALDYTDEYFRCLFAVADKSIWLANANTHARKLYHREDAPPFMPHLSLVYGNLTNAEKQAIIVEIGSRLNVSFPVSSMRLVSTTGEPKEWYKVKEFNFG